MNSCNTAWLGLRPMFVRTINYWCKMFDIESIILKNGFKC